MNLSDDKYLEGPDLDYLMAITVGFRFDYSLNNGKYSECFNRSLSCIYMYHENYVWDGFIEGKKVGLLKKSSDGLAE